MIQALLLIFSCTSIFLLSSKRHNRWGFVVGLMGQPFWIISAIQTEQWEILAVSVCFTLSHARGVRNHFKGGKV
jgi:hypothetical protein